VSAASSGAKHVSSVGASFAAKPLDRRGGGPLSVAPGESAHVPPGPVSDAGATAAPGSTSSGSVPVARGRVRERSGAEGPGPSTSVPPAWGRVGSVSGTSSRPGRDGGAGPTIAGSAIDPEGGAGGGPAASPKEYSSEDPAGVARSTAGPGGDGAARPALSAGADRRASSRPRLPSSASIRRPGAPHREAQHTAPEEPGNRTAATAGFARC
jgi:hypothetical protein